MEKILLDHYWIIIAVVLWSLPWKAAALWRAARRGHVGWFIALIILNTLAILDILYIFVFSKWGMKKVEEAPAPQPQQVEMNKEEEIPTYTSNKSKYVSGTRGRSTIV